MTITILTDCRDTNAASRQTSRYAALFPGATSILYGITHDIEAAGCIVDMLDAGLDTKQIIVANIAPRTEREHENGSPFFYAQIGNVLVIGTITTFSLLQKLTIISEVQETDVYEVCSRFLPDKIAQRIAHTQFRSFEYVPRLAKWLDEQKDIPSRTSTIRAIEKEYVWFVDNFGNCKTTITEQTDLPHTLNQLPFYPRLADVPLHTAAVTRGSSGYGEQRFLEVVVQGGNAAQELDLHVASVL